MKGIENAVVKKRILVVDDEPHILELVKISLEGDHFEILQAANGDEGLKLAGQKHPDLILLDIQMPGMDGYEVCRKLKTTKETEAIPVLILTSKDKPVDKERWRDSGASAYLTKPFSPLKLLAVVKEQLKP